MISAVAASRVSSVIAACALLVLQAACGGGDDTTTAIATPPAATVLPTSLTINVPSTRQAVGGDLKLSSNTSDPAKKLTYSWAFGDGTSSAEPNPTHRYSSSGSFELRLTVTNEAGASTSTITSVKVAELALVQGKFCTGADSGGWCWQNPLPQGNLIVEQGWLNDQLGWAVGESGTILKTVDGGAHWLPQSSGVDVRLTTLVIVSPSVVWAGGDNGLLVITEDGGLSWRSASLGRTDSLQGLQASDGRTAWLSTSSGSYATLDGGLSWTAAPRPEGNFYSAIVRTSPTQLWTAGADNNQGVVTMQRSRDGGKTWEVISLPAPSASTQYRALGGYKFADALRGVVTLTEAGNFGPNSNFAYRSVSLYTQDGGVSWQNMSPSSNEASGNPPNFLMTPDGSIFSVNTNYGGANELSANGGQTWAPVPNPKALGSGVASFTPRSANQAVIRAYNGRTYVTTNAGQSWVEPGSVTGSGRSSDTNSVWFFNSREGMAITNDGGTLRTDDGGQTWAPRLPPLIPAFSFGWRKLQFSADASVGWALSNTGDVYRSADKGSTWLSPVAQSSSPLGPTIDFHFVDNLRGWALADSYGGQGTNLFTSSNGGLSWQPALGVDNLVGMRSLRFGDATHGVAIGSAGIAMVTSDGGSSWQPRATGSTRGLNHLAFIDNRTVVGVGEAGAILRSTDGGQSWARVSSPNTNTLLNVRFVNAKLGHAVGAFGTVLVTQDGGLSWSDISVRTNTTLQSSYFLDENTGWVVGDNGAILVTVAGGR
jgi:photosystem II stability/assembly factor-like uncharacterized protein